MFQKFHIQMTIFASAITSIILIILTLICLIISENGIRKNSYTTFENNANSCINYVESQTTLSHQWILEAKNTYGIDMKILDNGKELFFNKINPTGEKEDLFQEIAQISKETEGVDVNSTDIFSITKTAFFAATDYYACTALIPKKDGILSIIILYPLNELKHQLTYQRIIFGGLVCLAILVMTVFSWLFIRKLLRPLEENRKKQTEFIAAASHELRSPLTVILTSIQALENVNVTETENLEKEKKRKKFISTIKSEGERMARLMEDMLSLANADNQSWSILKSSCELDTLILDIYEKYEPIFHQKKIHFFANLPEEPLEPYQCDSSRISQVLGILLDNAASYVPAQGKVSIELLKDEKAITIRISDNGPGIPDKNKERIFDRFYRADASRGSKQHFGLGLCIAKEIVTLHQGTITVQDTKGGGATFSICLPIQ